MLAEISIFIFWSAFFTVLAVKDAAFKTADPVEERLQRFFKPVPAAVSSSILLSPEETPSMKKFKETLALAGLRRKDDLENVLLFKRICKIAPAMLTALLFLWQIPIRHILFLGVMFMAIFLLIPRVWLIHRIMKRRKEIERNLPDALDLLILCLEAGLSFDSSLVKVGEELKRVSSELSREFIFTNQEILAGQAREQALKNLVWRCGVADLTGLVGAVLQSIKLGTSLVKTLRVQAETLRKKRKERLRALILKTPVKLIFPLLFFIFPTLVLVILGPSLINIFRHLSVTNVTGGGL